MVQDRGARVRRGFVRDHAALHDQQRRHACALLRRRQARRRRPAAVHPLRVRRLQHQHPAVLLVAAPGVAPEPGRRARRRKHPRRRRVRRGVAQGRLAAAEAERVRRLCRGGGDAGEGRRHDAGAAVHPGRLQRRPPRARVRAAAARAVRRRHLASARHGHAAVPQVHHRPRVVHRLRQRGREQGGLRGADGVLAAAQRQGTHRHAAAGAAHHDS
mmetsp:Transcript_16188/g.56513  ORF Transcript_16188/g.56513 Transcript_16188/m.56513 type:complete len:215 (+) Transcript_16188:1608-2252(+)